MLDAIPYLDEIRSATEMRFGIPAPVALVVAQVMQESGGNPLAVSKAGAKGMMQLIDATARFAADAGKFGKPSPFDPVWNLRAGIFYDRWIWDRTYYKDKCERWGATLSGFNGGPGWHQKRRALADDPEDFWNSVRIVNPGISESNQAENRAYPYRIVYVIQPKYAEFGPLVCGGRGN